MWATEDGLIDNVKVLLEFHVDVWPRNDRGQRALDIARKKNFKQIYKLLRRAQRWMD